MNRLITKYGVKEKYDIEIVVLGSGIRFRYFIFEISGKRHLLKLFYDELCSFSTFFALNFDNIDQSGAKHH
jgi:hypothetical protein